MSFLRRLFGKQKQQELDDALDDRLHEETLRDSGMSEQFIPHEMGEYRRRRAKNRVATAHWPRDGNGFFT